MTKFTGKPTKGAKVPPKKAMDPVAQTKVAGKKPIKTKTRKRKVPQRDGLASYADDMSKRLR